MTGVANLLDRRALGRFLIGDLLVIAGFLIAGELHHGIDPLRAPLFVAETLLPFLVGWVLVSGVFGAYSALTVDRPAAAPALAVPGWVAADVVGQLLRATTLVHGGASPLFTVVVGLGGALALVAWRTLHWLLGVHRG